MFSWRLSIALSSRQQPPRHIDGQRAHMPAVRHLLSSIFPGQRLLPVIFFPDNDLQL
jgi:hypothetical protein